jgi:AcrR family transcriptional regulator
MSVRLPAAERREQLLSVALEVFARQGFHGSSMNEVADRAGVTKPVLYQHFGSKRELYLSLLDEVGGRLSRAVAAAVAAAGSARAQVEQGFRAYFHWVADDHDSFMLLFGSSGRIDKEFAEARRRVEDLMASAIAELIHADVSREHRELLAYGLVGLAEVTSRRLVDRGAPFDADAVAVQLAELAWAGLRNVRSL